MTPQQIAQDTLRGWHAAKRGETINFAETDNWLEGFLMWTESHTLQLRSSTGSQRPSRSKHQPWHMVS